jgi:hypothetical protein
LITVFAETVHSGCEDAKDSEQVLEKLVGWAGVSRFAENHDLSTVALDKPFDKVKAEPCKAVAVGNHNCELIALQAAFQYGFKTFPIEVESAGDVGDNFGVRLFGFKVGNLSLQIVFLLTRTHPGVQHDVRRVLVSDKAVNVKQPLSRWCSDGSDHTCIGVLAKRVRVQSGSLTGFS